MTTKDLTKDLQKTTDNQLSVIYFKIIECLDYSKGWISKKDSYFEEEICIESEFTTIIKLSDNVYALNSTEQGPEEFRIVKAQTNITF